MATFQDNIETIRTAIYGKEMRPAISEALSQSWAKVESMMDAVDRLNSRVDSMSGDGGDNPDSGIIITDDLFPPILWVYGAETALEACGIPESL